MHAKPGCDPRSTIERGIQRSTARGGNRRQERSGRGARIQARSQFAQHSTLDRETSGPPRQEISIPSTLGPRRIEEDQGRGRQRVEFAIRERPRAARDSPTATHRKKHRAR